MACTLHPSLLSHPLLLDGKVAPPNSSVQTSGPIAMGTSLVGDWLGVERGPCWKMRPVKQDSLAPTSQSLSQPCP